MYNLIADMYNEIFPVETDKVNFIKSYCKSMNSRILDVGCATGELALKLAHNGYSVVGIDLNSSMINIAKKDAEKQNLSVDFCTDNMMNLSEENEFDCVLCMGNTLPHILNWNEIDLFIKSIQKLLKKDGIFIFQILNYDKILREKSICFTIQENNRYKFIRDYIEIELKKIIFKITLIDKQKNETYIDQTDLLPITKNEIVHILEENNFSDINCFSDYNKSSSSSDDFYNLYVSRKK